MPGDLEEIFASLDADGSGEIDYSEWISATLERKAHCDKETRTFKDFKFRHTFGFHNYNQVIQTYLFCFRNQFSLREIVP